MTATQVQTFDPFAKEHAYIRVNERLIDRALRRLSGSGRAQMLDVAAGTGLMTNLALARAKALGIELQSTLVDLDLAALHIARQEVNSGAARYVYGSADRLPFRHSFDVSIFANALHLLDEDAKEMALIEISKVLRPGGIFAINSTFYEGAYPEESKPFYSRWIRRSIVEVNRRLPDRSKGEKAQAMEFLTADAYCHLLQSAGFEIAEVRERRVLLSQSAVRAICSYKNFAMGALHATEEDAEQASLALQTTVQQTFRDLHMKYLPRNWLEIIAVRP